MQQHIALPVGHGNRNVQFDRRHRALRPKHANDALALVHQRDQIDQDASGMSDRARKIVDEMERRDIALALAGNDGPAARLVRTRT